MSRDNKVIENRWVLRIKIKANGNLHRFRARLVGKGCSQNLVSVAHFDTVRTVLSVAASETLKLKDCTEHSCKFSNCNTLTSCKQNNQVY